eukprot:19514-Alexandrium_andersonii.AAC.1
MEVSRNGRGRLAGQSCTQVLCPSALEHVPSPHLDVLAAGQPGPQAQRCWNNGLDDLALVRGLSLIHI